VNAGSIVLIAIGVIVIGIAPTVAKRFQERDRLSGRQDEPDRRPDAPKRPFRPRGGFPWER
jgi:cell division septation protein DedD